MIVNSSTASATATNQMSDAKKASLDYDAFLKLLLAQLKSQDPTDPVDQSQTLAQLASFSNVEQTIKLNDKLNMLIGQMGASQSVQLIGRRIESLADGTVGTVAAVEITDGAAVAVLEDGKRVSISGGVRVSSNE
ncbi:MAG: flagellar hook capping FlgD N-terminal domain-containing protein [Aestuariivirga sp.]